MPLPYLVSLPERLSIGRAVKFCGLPPEQRVVFPHVRESPVLQWTAYLLVGLAIGRLPLRRASTRHWLSHQRSGPAVPSRVMSDLQLAQGFSSLGRATTGTTLEVVQVQVRKEGVPPTTTWGWQAVAAPHTATPFDLAHTIGTALLVAWLCCSEAGSSEPARGGGSWCAPRSPYWLAAAGSMTLTLFTLHVLLLNQLTDDSAGDGAFLLLQVSTALAVAWLVAVVRSVRAAGGGRRSCR